MKDPTQEILDSIETMLSGNLSYGDTTYSIVQDLPRVEKFRHVWLRNIRCEEDGDQDTYITYCDLEIEIVASGFKQRGQRANVNSISNQLLQLLVDKDVSMTSFTTIGRPRAVIMSETEEITEDDIIKRKIITLKMIIEEN